MPSDSKPIVTAEDALVRLRQGNARYVSGIARRPEGGLIRRVELLQGQSPFCTVLTCADSRVPPELIFDQGLGDLFVIRVAGNILDGSVLGSIEYAAIYLEVSLVVVMGHSQCGAVGAAVKNDDDNPNAHDYLDTLIEQIRPAVKIAIAQGEHDLLRRSVVANAQRVAQQIQEVVHDDLRDKQVVVLPAYYNLESGVVEWLAGFSVDLG